MNHYYRNDDNLKSQKRVLDLYINDNKLSFVSDIGVFSNTQIDYGSYTFLKTILKEESVDTLLDVGCGYGVLGITLKYLKHANNVDMIDINERAVELTKLNIEKYKLEYQYNEEITRSFKMGYYEKATVNKDKLFSGINNNIII